MKKLFLSIVVSLTAFGASADSIMSNVALGASIFSSISQVYTNSKTNDSLDKLNEKLDKPVNNDVLVSTPVQWVGVIIVGSKPKSIVFSTAESCEQNISDFKTEGFEAYCLELNPIESKNIIVTEEK